jgi:hypothetical protein
MFKNAERDPLAIPSRGARRPSMGPMRRVAAAAEDAYDREAEDEMHRRHQERGGEGTPDPRDFHANLPRPVAKVLDREARAFMEREGNTDDRSELLYRARRHASTLTSTWSRDASEKVTTAFCGRVAALIPSRPRMAAAQPVTKFADFDDSLLY